MSNDMIPFQQSQLPAFMQQIVGNDDINKLATTGIGGESINHISIAGGRFTVVRGQDKQPLPVWELELIFVLVNPGINKAYYATAWNPDQDASPPDCSSDDGITPRMDSPNLQCNTCAGCPQNQFGSKINPQTGKQGKACSDKKFAAVVSPGQAGGEILRLAVPTASLGDLAAMLRQLPKVPYYAVVVGVSFDTTATYPKLKFRPVRYVSELEFQIVLERHNSDEAKQFAGVSGAQPLRLPAEGAPQIPVQQVPVQQAAQQPVQQQVQQPVQQQVQQPVQQQAPQGFGQAPTQQQAPQQAQQPQGFGQAPAQEQMQQAPQQQVQQPQQGFDQAPQQAPQQADQPVTQPQVQQAPAAAPDVAAIFAGQAFGQQQTAPQQQAPQQTQGGIPDVLPSGRVPGKPSPGKKRRTKVEMDEDRALGLEDGAATTEPAQQPQQQVQQPQQQVQQQAPANGQAQPTQQGFGQAPQQPQQPQQFAQQQQAPQGFGQPAPQQAQTFEQPAQQPQVMTGNAVDAFAGWDD